MLVSAVLDPSAFDVEYFDENELYMIQAVDFLKGIQKNGLLIVDSGNRLRDALVRQYEALPSKPRGRLRILVEELLLKKGTRRIIACHLSLGNIPSMNLLDLAYNLKADTEADALIVGNESLERLESDQRYSEDIVPLSEYRDSDFEKDRQRYESQIGPIDTLPESEVENIIIRSVRFTKWLRFYDPYIGRGNNTSDFREGIEYILSLWYEHGFFLSQEGTGSVEIFARKGQYVQDQHYRIVQELVTPLEEQFPWSVKFLIKNDPRRIFHARYLETQHAIIRIERGFDFFDQDNEFLRNFFTLNMAESSHLKECRDLRNAVLR